MCKPVEASHRVGVWPCRARSPSDLWAAAALLLVVLPAAATAQLTNEAEPPPALERTAPVPPEPPTTDTGGGWRVQCWQHGRLLFEETHVSLPTEGTSRFALKLAGQDAQGRPLYLAETVNATCRVRYDRGLFKQNPALPR